MGENQAKGNLERDKIPKMEMDRTYIEASKWKCSKESMEWNPQGGRRRTQDYMANTLRMEAEHQGKSWPEIKALNKNRIRWRAFIKGLCLSEG
jgi:hypothetical protein